MEVPPDLEPFYEVTFILCAAVLCRTCYAEVEYASAHPECTNENYLDQARTLKDAGWILDPPDSLNVMCPACQRAGR